MSLAILLTLLSGCGGGDSGGSAPETNTSPVADAGQDQVVTTGSSVTLDGSGSSDSDGDSLSYQWTLYSSPNGSSVSLNSANTAAPSFIPDVDGEYVLSLVVSDSESNSLVDSIVVSSSSSGASTTRSYAIVDTNQSLCYNSASGQQETCTGKGYDADYAGNQPNYSVSSGGTVVTDNVTGLVWRQSSDTNGDGKVNYDDKFYQSEAVSYCEQLTFAGRSDWRLPNIKEAFSIIMFSGQDPSGYTGTDTSQLTAFLHPVFDWAFGDLDNGDSRIIDGQYATSTLYTSTTMNGSDTMFGMNYVDGRIKGYPQYNKKYYTRCVAGASTYGINNFVDNQDQTISDNATGLMWQQNDSASSNWDDAIAQCEAATTASHTDWRLPNVKELHSILDYSRSPDMHSSAAIDPMFNATSFTNEAGVIDWGAYWASTTHANYIDGITDNGSSGSYVSFGRALGYMNGNVIDVHGAGAQRSNDKTDVASTPGAQSATGATGTFYYKGPQGDILRDDNKVRCVRDISEEATTNNGYTLFAPMKSTETFLIDEGGNTVHTWSSNTRPGLSVYLLENGELLRTGIAANTPSTFQGQFGGSAGVIEVLDWQSNVVWSKTLATETYLSHHDVEPLPNGNILAVVWEAKTAAEAQALGRTSVSGDTLWAGAVYEICRASASNNCTDGDIVWRWSTWEHVIQDTDNTIATTYVTDISAHPDKVNLNYTTGKASSDWTHINSVDYNATTDQIVLSVRSFSEYWIIDHSDASQGIVTRVGNPAAYNGTGEQTLYAQHDAQWIEKGFSGAGNIMVFNNGQNRPEGDFSSVDEFCHQSGGCTLGAMVASYSEGVSGEFYADHISGAHRLENGNTLVCEGTEGRLFEYNPSHQVVWEYNYGSEIFRATRYESDYSGLAQLN